MKKEEITIEDLQPQLRDIAETIGLENTIALVKLMGGITFYFPTYKNMCRDARTQKIRAEYNGYNVHELARKYGITANAVYKILHRK